MARNRWLLILGVSVAAIIGLGIAFADPQDSDQAASSSSSPSPSTSESASSSPTPSPSSSSTPEDTPEPTDGPEPKQVLDERAVLAMLKTYTRLYNAGDYINASGYVSSRLEDMCGGPTALAFALSEMHRVEKSDYAITAVKAWDDDPGMADVTIVDTFAGDSFKQKLGLAFVRDDGRWKIDELFPLGTESFCV